MNNKQKTIVGALWENTAKSSGLTFWSGKLEIGEHKIDLIIFENHQKKKETSPDFTIYQINSSGSISLANFAPNELRRDHSSAEHEDSDDIPF